MPYLYTYKNGVVGLNRDWWFDWNAGTPIAECVMRCFVCAFVLICIYSRKWRRWQFLRNVIENVPWVVYTVYIRGNEGLEVCKAVLGVALAKTLSPLQRLGVPVDLLEMSVP